MKQSFVLFAWMLSVCAAAWSQQAEYESFENGVPACFAATRAESLSISPWHYKQGQHSLRWDWRQGEELVIRHGIGDLSRKGGIGNSQRPSFSVWLYMEKPIAGSLVVEFRQGENVAGSFRFPLEFTGWRQGRPFYNSILRGKLAMNVDNIRIAAPTAVANGTTFFDFIKYNTLTHGSREILPEKVARWRPPVPDERRFPKPDRVTEAELVGIRKLLGPEEGTGINEAQVKRLCQQVKALGIVRDEHGVRGPGIDRHYQYCSEIGEHGTKSQNYWPDEHGPDWLGVEPPIAMTSLALQVAKAYRTSHDTDQRRRLADAFLLIEDHLFDQGMQAGSGFEWNWWIGPGWADAVFLMRDVLAKANCLARQRDYLIYNYGGREIFAETDPPSHMDYYLLSVPSILRPCLMQVEPTEQVCWLRAFKAMLERSILQPTSALKIDGCAYHHAGHYFGYAFAAVPGLAGTVQKLSETPWRLNAEAHERVRRAALAQRIFCNQRDLPLSLSGRQPFVEYCSRINPEGLDRLARSGTPDGKQAIDPEVAAAYLRLEPKAAEKEPYRNLGIKPEPEPNGCFVMPYGALLCHRRDNWLASVHGQSKYCWGTERQTKVNCFGLFQGLGSLEILAGGNPVTAKESGRAKLGWDWRRYEGTTVPQLPLEMIDKQWTSAYSPEVFVGGLSHQGRQGIFAMLLNQPMPGKKTLKGRKSWFFNDERILCLGSDISCDEAEYPTQTTLCQKGLAKDKKGVFAPTCLDGMDFAGFPEERALDEARTHWFLDVQQTGYYLPAGQKVVVARRHQKSREYQDLMDTEGDFLTAWIDHGKAPGAASYEYMLAVRATPATMQEVAARPPYRIMQRDPAAHIVWDTAGRRWGCVFFIAQEVAPRTVAAEALPIKTVDWPCLIMADSVTDGRLDMSVADPDLNLGKMAGASGDNGGWFAHPPRPLRVSLRGAWRLLDATATVCAWHLPDARENVRILSTNSAETVLEILCQHGASYDIRLTRLSK